MYYFIVNPISKSGQGQKVWKRIDALLQNRSIPYQVFFTQYQHHATLLTEKLLLNHPSCTLIAVGGDGTIHEVLNGIHNPSLITFGCIPTGSGNDFSRGLHIPSNPEKALELILHPVHIHKLDIGRMKTPYGIRSFGVSAGMGFDAAICQRTFVSPIKNICNKLGLGKLTYCAVALRELYFYHPTTISVEMDGKRRFVYEKALFLSIMNLPYEGGGAKFCPDANSTDQIFHVCVVENISKRKALFLFPTVFFGFHTRAKEVHILTCRYIHLHSDRPIPVHSDGEVLGHLQDIVLYPAKEQLSVITG